MCSTCVNTGYAERETHVVDQDVDRIGLMDDFLYGGVGLGVGLDVDFAAEDLDI